jgi:hypothetical protein
MAYKKLTRRSYTIIKTTIWLLPVVNSSTCKLWKITKHDHCIYHITSCGYTISQNTPCKNKLDVSTLLLHVLRGLWELQVKNDSYLWKATMVILWLLTSIINLMTTIVRETGIHQPHMWNKPHVKCGAGLANEVTQSWPGPLRSHYATP